MPDTTRQLETERYLAHAGKIRLDDVPWDEGARVGLSADEVFTLGYFADIEGQTLRYLKQLLAMHDALDDDVAAFLTTWNYEEFFHGRAFNKLLALAGHAQPEGRPREVASAARLNEWIERVAGPVLGRLLPRQLPAVYMSFGAVQELTTLRGYESIAARTPNPALRLLAQRIAKQERRHFTWYFQRAERLLEGDRLAQRLTRFLLEHNWVPVGAGVKPEADVRRLFRVLFPNRTGGSFARDVDGKIGTLPGLRGIRLLQAYMAREIAAEGGANFASHGRAMRARLRGELRESA